MARKPKKNIEGVVTQEKRRNLGNFSETRPLQNVTPNVKRKQLGFEEVDLGLEDDTDNNEQAIELDGDKEEVKKQSKFKKMREKRKEKKQARKEKWAKRHPLLRGLRRGAQVLFLLLILMVGMLGLKSWLALNNIVDRSGGDVAAIRDHIDKIGRINILLVGVGGEGHDGGDLADSIIVASIDPFANDVVMLSIPRDLYVTIPNYGSDRINASHAYGEMNDHPGGGVALLSETIKENLDIDIHYFVRADFKGFIDAVNTIGGIEVTLDRRIYDPNFDWEYGPNSLDLQPGVNQLDGVTALLLARARGAAGNSIGLEKSDFSRTENQRLMLVALKDKVLSAGTYANPLKISSLIDTVGSHVRTNLNPPNDFIDLNDIAGRITNENIKSIGLEDVDGENYLVGGNVGGASVLLPRTGDFTEIQSYLASVMQNAFLRREAPTVDVYNGTAFAGLATVQADKLEDLGYNITKVGDAPRQDYQKTVIYDLSDGTKPKTKELLEERYNVILKSRDKLPKKFQNTESNFVIIIGQDNA